MSEMMHKHMCFFEMLYDKRYAKKRCKNYLKTKNMKRDKCLSCCDEADLYGCKYMKIFTIEEADGKIIIE